jgi:hypothetical protein
MPLRAHARLAPSVQEAGAGTIGPWSCARPPEEIVRARKERGRAGGGGGGGGAFRGCANAAQETAAARCGRGWRSGVRTRRAAQAHAHHGGHRSVRKVPAPFFCVHTLPLATIHFVAAVQTDRQRNRHTRGAHEAGGQLRAEGWRPAFARVEAMSAFDFMSTDTPAATEGEAEPGACQLAIAQPAAPTSTRRQRLACAHNWPCDHGRPCQTAGSRRLLC